ncbi:MAG TPA: AraC family transcriptional regulator [Clostridia bacterium]|nr:AraC family transcriptional regulator [Clostridia bacterium]
MFFEELGPATSYRAGLYQIDDISLHWKKSLVLLCVLEGEITVRIDDETYLRKKLDVDIINPGEMRSYKGLGPNRVLFIELCPIFFDDYVKGSSQIYYYVDQRDTKKDQAKYSKLRRWMMMLAYEYFYPKEDSTSFSEDLLVDLMYHLLNQFHYLYYEQQELRDDLVELRRFHRIFTYLDVNFKEGASLQELAEQEYLSPSYLSYKIKDTLGLNFHDYLGALRSEAGAKLLLSTDKSVSEIALDVGFSHPRYFVKRFEEVYHQIPQDFRELHSKKQEDYKELTPDKKEFLLELAHKQRYHFNGNSKTISVDLNKETLASFERAQCIFLGEAVYYLEKETQDLLKRVQKEIGFKQGILAKLFSQDMDIYQDHSRRFHNWTRVESVLELLVQEGLSPLIYCKGVENDVLEDFIQTFSPIYPGLEDWLIKKAEAELIFSSDQDQFSQAIEVIKNPRDIPLLVDQMSREIPLENDTFFGGEGLFTANFLAKPSYYARGFLAMMGDELLEEGPGYLLTRSREGYQLFFYQEESPKKIAPSLTLYGMKEDMSLSRFTLSARYGSIYDAWKNLGSPKRLEKEYWDFMEAYIHPLLEFEYVERENLFSVRRQSKEAEITLYLFKEIQ